MRKNPLVGGHAGEGEADNISIFVDSPVTPPPPPHSIRFYQVWLPCMELLCLPLCCTQLWPPVISQSVSSDYALVQPGLTSPAKP